MKELRLDGWERSGWVLPLGAGVGVAGGVVAAPLGDGEGRGGRRLLLRLLGVVRVAVRLLAEVSVGLKVQRGGLTILQVQLSAILLARLTPWPSLVFHVHLLGPSLPPRLPLRHLQHLLPQHIVLLLQLIDLRFFAAHMYYFLSGRNDSGPAGMVGDLSVSGWLRIGGCRIRYFLLAAVARVILTHFYYYNNIQMSKEVRVVETVRGEIPADSLSSFTTCLFHERLTPIVHPSSCDRPLSLEHLHYHQHNPLSLENSSVTPPMLDHQLLQVSKSPGEVIILDSSTYESRVPEILEKYCVVKGYQYRLSGSPALSQNAVLLSKDHIYKQVQYQFKLGNGKYKPGFIGQLTMEECLESSPYFHAFEAYLQFSSKTNCPIIINSLQPAVKAVSLHLSTAKRSAHPQIQQLKVIQLILQKCQGRRSNKVVVYNLPLLFQTTINLDFTLHTLNLLHPYITELFSKYDCYFGFDLTKYHCKQAHYYIGQLVALYPQRLLLSAGITYKTDLTTYAGSGYQLYKGQSIDSILAVAGEKVQSALLLNKLGLLSWKTRIEQTKIVVFWRCNNCSTEHPESVESFRKFGKQFCSIPCLKGYKF